MLTNKIFQELLDINNLNKRVDNKENDKEEEKKKSMEDELNVLDKDSDVEVQSEEEEEKKEDFSYPSKLTKLEKYRKVIEYQHKRPKDANAAADNLFDSDDEQDSEDEDAERE